MALMGIAVIIVALGFTFLIVKRMRQGGLNKE
jgi:hypothetical protein